MAIATLILGESGTGKSDSMRDLNPSDCALIQCTKKPLPFFDNLAEWKKRSYFSTDYEKIKKAILSAVKGGTSIILIDDAQYLMAHEFMSRSMEVGFNKFNEIANHFYSLIEFLNNLPDEVRVYILAHTEQTDQGRIKIKTIGKMLDDKITIEGKFTIVLRTHVEGGSYHFSTQNSGNDTVKSPRGMFTDQLIDNNLQLVDDAICRCYQINEDKGE